MSYTEAGILGSSIVSLLPRIVKCIVLAYSSARLSRYIITIEMLKIGKCWKHLASRTAPDDGETIRIYDLKR